MRAPSRLARRLACCVVSLGLGKTSAGVIHFRLLTLTGSLHRGDVQQALGEKKKALSALSDLALITEVVASRKHLALHMAEGVMNMVGLCNRRAALIMRQREERRGKEMKCCTHCHSSPQQPETEAQELPSQPVECP